MYSKRNKKIILYVFVLLCLLNKNLANASESNKLYKQKILDYLSNVGSFTSNFIQANGKTTEEGSISIDNKRIRVDYLKPSKIRITMNSKKVMYFNLDLKEVEYFNPKESIAEMFYNIFYNPQFINESIIANKKSSIILEREVKTEDEKINIIIFFEKKPFILRKIQIEWPNETLNFGLYNINHNSTFDKGFFSMVNPLIVK
ncbi:outer membrane lipoprotein carrier protein LolA [Alphaproteobacteria bacterium]|nr:outer membrane lipoprotein carrier protein LolA [Alphaproteobacteria bacterium]